MKSIKPLNDRIKRLQKFAVKTSHVSASSGNSANSEITGGFEKKSGNNFDLKNLNLSGCRLCECYHVEEIVTDTDTGSTDNLDRIHFTTERGFTYFSHFYIVSPCVAL